MSDHAIHPRGFGGEVGVEGLEIWVKGEVEVCWGSEPWDLRCLTYALKGQQRKDGAPRCVL